MNKFWLTTAMVDMTSAQWESLCDGCGKCCLHKLIDDTTDDMYVTNLACSFLDINTCRCSVYEDRQAKQPNCIIITSETLAQAYWLPDSCAYQLVAKGEDLPAWHPLQTHDANSTLAAGQAVNDWAISERDIPTSEWEDYIMNKIPLQEI